MIAKSFFLAKDRHPIRMRILRDHSSGGPAEELVPAGLRLRADPATRVVARGSVLVGGSPVHVLRLTPAGARQVSGWFTGLPVPDTVSARTLARRLLDAGIAHPDFAGSLSLPGLLTATDVTVVIPVRD